MELTGLECKCGNHSMFETGEHEEIDDGGGDTHDGRPIVECHVCDRQYYYSQDEFGTVGLEEI